MSATFRIILGLIVMVVGFLIVWKTEVVFSWFGVSEFAEKKLGTGGSRFFYKLIGVLVVFMGVFIATNIISSILEGFANIFVR